MQGGVAYIEHWWGYALDPWSRFSPRPCEEVEALLLGPAAIVCPAECQCRRPSAPLLGSSCLRKSWLSWRQTQLTVSSLSKIKQMYEVWKVSTTYFLRMGMTGFKMASNMFMRMEFPINTGGVLTFNIKATCFSISVPDVNLYWEQQFEILSYFTFSHLIQCSKQKSWSCIFNTTANRLSRADLSCLDCSNKPLISVE